MNILILGSGGREHTLAWCVAKSADVETVFVSPGNAGTATELKCENVALDPSDFSGLVGFCKDHDVGLTVIGPEAPLVDGVVDAFDAADLVCCGPSQAAAQLEGSKAFAKEFMVEFGIPTAGYTVAEDVNTANVAIEKYGAPVVIKANGLAAGKGVTVAQSTEEARSVASDMLLGRLHGSAGTKIVIEEFLTGEEASYMCLCDGERYVAFATSQDHKAIYEGDKGPNTGGMGAYSPAPVLTSEIEKQIQERVIEPVLCGMQARGTPYKGFLYAGLMISATQEVNVIEFNCRFGDPEAQAVLTRLDSDLVDLCIKAATGSLENTAVQNIPEHTLAVVMASGGYPGSYETGHVIAGLDSVSADSQVFHAGTKHVDSQIVTDGGRVLAVVSKGESIRNAKDQAYADVARISWADVYFRNDIGHRALART